MSKKEIEIMRLITIFGDFIDVEYPADNMEEFYQDFENHQGKYWNIGDLSGSATYKGYLLSMINMNLVMGLS